MSTVDSCCLRVQSTAKLCVVEKLRAILYWVLTKMSQTLVLLHVMSTLVHTVTQLYSFSHGWGQGPDNVARILLVLCLLAQFSSMLASSSGRLSLQGSTINCWET